MRHIPEDELHAYLDQALSRSQCVEIESHLAGCLPCRNARDGIAALRDRTTALLAQLAPQRRIPPPAEQLRERALARQAHNRRRWQQAAWAASVAGALALGWMLSGVAQRPPTSTLVTASPAPAESPAVTEEGDATAAPALAVGDDSQDSVVATQSGRERAPTSGRDRADGQEIAIVERDARPASDSSLLTVQPATFSQPAEPVGSVLSSGRFPAEGSDPPVPGLWRTLSWVGAERERGRQLPRIAGLPVMGVQVASDNGAEGKPTMIVAQQLSSGQVIRTIEGPATDVTRLLASSRADGESPWPTIGDSSFVADSDGAVAMLRGDRMLAIQAPLPPDSLRAMIRRLNAEQR